MSEVPAEPENDAALASPGEEPPVSVRNVWTWLGGEVVHRDISFDLRRSEILGMVGGSGSGKTTLLREVIGLRQPDRGRIQVLGEPLDAASSGAVRGLRERCGVVFQGGALFSSLPVFDNIALPLRELRILDESMVADLVCLKLAMVGLQGRDARRMPSELSGGMVRRVALARALALEPELLFLDEPTAGLDPVSRDEFVELLALLRQELDLSVMMISHDLDTLVQLSDRIAVLADQTLVALGAVAEVLGSDHPFVSHFFRSMRESRAPGRKDGA